MKKEESIKVINTYCDICKTDFPLTTYYSEIDASTGKEFDVCTECYISE